MIGSGTFHRSAKPSMIIKPEKEPNPHLSDDYIRAQSTVYTLNAYKCQVQAGIARVGCCDGELRMVPGKIPWHEFVAT